MIRTVGELIRDQIADVGVVQIGRNNHGTRIDVDEEKPPVAEVGLVGREGKGILFR